ncbi:MAG: hypothetical protein IPN90_04870 [Elusimicrobia bacterium]|nr:hypothetical protein [Elusimicrobiota bacterium]
MSLFVGQPGWTAFEESHTGGRATALDGAMTAATGDVFAMHYNPGSLCDLMEPEAGLYYGRLVKGFDDGGDTSRSFFGWASPSPWGTVGLSYSGYGAADVYSEETLSLGYARAWRERVRWGAVANYLRKSANTNSSAGTVLDPVTGDPVPGAGSPADLSATAWDMTLGAQWVPSDRWRVGVTVAHVLEPDLGFYGKDSVDRVWKVGGGYDTRWGMALVEGSYQNINDKGQARLKGGIEKTMKYVVLRLGGGVGAENYSRLTTGVGARFRALRVDYGYLLPLDTAKDDSGTHQISVALGLGGPDE